MLEGLNQFANRPWAEMRRGKEITDMWLAQQLRPYGVRPTTFRIEGELGKGHVREDLMEVFRRSIPRGEVEELKEREI